jgi:predicted amidohydrolase YtcJ
VSGLAAALLLLAGISTTAPSDPADLVLVLSRDPLSIPARALDGVRVDQTVAGGRTIYSRSD